MRHLDQMCAWTMLLVSILFMLLTEILNLRGAILEDPFPWLLAAMVNFVRLRNQDRTVIGLKVVCIGANLIILTLEAVRFGMCGTAIFRNWGPYTLIVAFAALGETIFSIMPTKETQ